MTDLITTKQAAEQLGISCSAVARLDHILNPVWPCNPDKKKGRGKRYNQYKITEYKAKILQQTEKDPCHTNAKTPPCGGAVCKPPTAAAKELAGRLTSQPRKPTAKKPNASKTKPNLTLVASNAATIADSHSTS